MEDFKKVKDKLHWLKKQFKVVTNGRAFLRFAYYFQKFNLNKTFCGRFEKEY